MSVGKDSILRAANAEAKNTEAKAEPVKPAEEKKALTEVKETAKTEIPVKESAAKKAPAKKTRTAKTKTAAKTAAAPKAVKKTTPRKKAVKTSVLTPENSEELQAAFVKDKTPEEVNGPVHVNEELPVYLL